MASGGAAVLAKAGASSGTYPGRVGRAHTITAIGMKASLGATASVGQSAHYSANNEGRVKSSGYSIDRGISTSTQFIQIPPCTGSLDLNETRSKELSISAVATMSGGLNWHPMSLTTPPLTSTITGTVTGEAGDDAADAPTGAYAVAVSCEPYKWGYMKCHVKVVTY